MIALALARPAHAQEVPAAEAVPPPALRPVAASVRDLVRALPGLLPALPPADVEVRVEPATPERISEMAASGRVCRREGKTVRILDTAGPAQAMHDAAFEAVQAWLDAGLHTDLGWQTWVRGGLAEHARASWDGRAFAPGRIPAGAVRRLREARAARGDLDLRVMAAVRGALNASEPRGRDCRAHAWSFVHFLLAAPERSKRLDAYLAAAGVQGDPGGKLLDKTLADGGTTPEDVERDWRAHCDGLWERFLRQSAAEAGTPAGGGDGLAAAVARLGDADWDAREAAARTLARSGPQAIRALLPLRDAADAEVRARVERILEAAAPRGDEFAFVRDWLVIGPFDNPDDRGLETAFGPETEAFDAGKAYPARNGSAAAWRRWSAMPSGYVDLDAACGGDDRAVAYAAVVLTSAERRVIPFWAGSDDGMRVYVNNRPVHLKHEHRGAAPGQDAGLLPLEQGRNVVMVKVEDGTKEWGFYFQVALWGGVDGVEVETGRDR